MKDQRKNIGREGKRGILRRFSSTNMPDIPETDLKDSGNYDKIDFNKKESKMGHYPLHNLYEDDPSKHSIDVGFLIVATGKYDIFVEPLIRSIEENVLPNNRKFYNIFSDKNIIIGDVIYSIFNIDHKPFPYPTLKRFHFFDKYNGDIVGDQIIYIDADTLIKSKIGTEILYPITVTQHCGFVDRIGSFERRSMSSCYINPRDCKNYFGGGFYSFSREEFFKMNEFCKKAIDKDESMGIVPVWHDESALNKYISMLHPSRVLSPSYHYPENNEKIYSSWGENNYECKILLLDKNHKEIRS
jgi:hypothetical protein